MLLYVTWTNSVLVCLTLAAAAIFYLFVINGFHLPLMQKIAAEKALPFDLLVPNEETIEAMKAARRGEVKKVSSVNALFANLDEE